MLKSTIFLLFLLCSSNVFAKSTYTAIISCGFQGSHINILPCFSDTELKISTKKNSKVYKIYDFYGLGESYQDGLHIDLPESFQLTAQNSSGDLVLGIKIINKEGLVVFNQQAGKWGVIKVKSK